MIFLIDGYNLLHAVGWASAKMRQPQLDPARRRLLDWLAESAPAVAKADRFRVVFDAMHGPFASLPRSYRGVIVEFAYRSTADDLIEELLAAELVPREVVVVSNDLRLHESARRVRSQAWDHGAFLDYLNTFTERRLPVDQASAPEKPTVPAADEAAELLRAFSVPRRL